MVGKLRWSGGVSMAMTVARRRISSPHMRMASDAFCCVSVALGFAVALMCILYRHLHESFLR